MSDAGQGGAAADPVAAAMQAVVSAPTIAAKNAALDNYERVLLGGAATPSAPAAAQPSVGGGAPHSPDAMRSAFDKVMNAPTPQARAAALTTWEQMNGGAAPPAPAAAQPSTPSPRVQAALDRLKGAEGSPEWNAAMRDLKDAHEQDAAEATGDTTAAEPFTDFPAPQSASEYQFAVPPGASPIVNDEAAGAIKAALFDAGVPSEFANLAFQNAARNHAAGVLESDDTYKAAALSAKAAVEKQLGADAPATLKLAIDYLNGILAGRPELQEAIDLAMVDPHTLMHAATLARAQRR